MCMTIFILQLYESTRVRCNWSFTKVCEWHDMTRIPVLTLKFSLFNLVYINNTLMMGWVLFLIASCVYLMCMSSYKKGGLWVMFYLTSKPIMFSYTSCIITIVNLQNHLWYMHEQTCFWKSCVYLYLCKYCIDFWCTWLLKLWMQMDKIINTQVL